MTVLSDDELINLYIANCGNESGYKDVAKSLRAVAEAAVAAECEALRIRNDILKQQYDGLLRDYLALKAQREEPLCYASLNKQGDVTSVAMRKDSWRTVPLYTQPPHTSDTNKMVVPDEIGSDDIQSYYGLAYAEGWNACRDAILATQKEPT